MFCREMQGVCHRNKEKTGKRIRILYLIEDLFDIIIIEQYFRIVMCLSIKENRAFSSEIRTFVRFCIKNFPSGCRLKSKSRV